MVDVTPFGARLRLKRPTEIGRLLHLTTMMPRQLRCFDHIERSISRLVAGQKCEGARSEKKENGAVIENWRCFLSASRPPKSFEENPIRRYDNSEKFDSGLWTLQERSVETLFEIGATDRRKETRHTIPVDIFIEVFSEQGGIEEKEQR